LSPLGQGKFQIFAAQRILPDQALFVCRDIELLTALGDMTSPPCEHVLGLDGIAIVVNKSNPVGNLSRKQIQAIFSGQTTDWSKVGGSSGHIDLFARDDRWLNSNKGTKREIGFYIRPFRPWISALFATPKNVSLWSASFGGLIPTVSCSFSSEKSYSPSR
jgi:PBP superfamily domain